jgi:hypothetical protein
MHSMMRLDDAGADIRVNVGAQWEQIVRVVQKERNWAAGNRRQIQSGRLQVDTPATAGVLRGRKRDYFGGNRAWPVQREKGPIARTPDVMLDIGVEEVGKSQGWTTRTETLGEVIGAGARVYPDVNSALQEIVILTVAQKSDCEFVSATRDDERHIENIGLTGVLYNLNIG